MLLSEQQDVTDFEGRGAPQLDRLIALERLWASKRKGGALPSKADFPPEEIRPWLGHIMLVDVHADPIRFRVRLMGVRLVNYAGKDYTGRWLDEVFEGERLQRNIKPHLTCLKTRQPCYDSSAYILDGSRKIILHRLHLPCADDGDTVNVFLGCGYAAEEPDEP